MPPPQQPHTVHHRHQHNNHPRQHGHNAHHNLHDQQQQQQHHPHPAAQQQQPPQQQQQSQQHLQQLQQQPHLQQQQQQHPPHHQQQHNSLPQQQQAHHQPPAPAGFTPQPSAHMGHDVMDHPQPQQHLARHQRNNPQQSHAGPAGQQMPHMAPQPVQPGPNMQVPNAHNITQQPQLQQQQHHHHHQPNNSQHNHILKHQPHNQQAPIPSPQMTPQQPHHHLNQHNQNQQPIHHVSIPLPQSMAPQHWVGPHPPQGQPSHSQHPPHPSQQNPPPNHPQQQQAGHHLNQAHGASVMLGQYHNTNFMYSHMGHHQFVPPTGHPAAPPFEHSVASHQQDSMNLPQQATQQQQQTQLRQQQHAVSISNHHPNNSVTTNQLSNTPNISAASTTVVTNMHQINTGPMMDAHMANRITMNHYPIMSYMNPYGHPLVMPPGYMPDMNHYTGAPMAPPPGPPVAAPMRVSSDLGIKPQFEGQIAPLPPSSTVSQTPGGKPPAIVPSTSNLTTPMRALPPIKPRERKALAIVDPHTKHVFTVDELKGSPSTPQSQSSKDSGMPGISSKEPSISDKDPSSSEATTAKSSVAESTSGEVSAAETTPLKQASTTHEAEHESKEEVAVIDTEETTAIENGDLKSHPDHIANMTENLASIKVPSDDKPSCESTDIDEIPEKKVLPNLPYAKGQFSPLNLTGSKRYSIDFLKAVAKEMDIELDNTFSSNHRVDFVPNYIKGGYSMSGAPLVRRSSQQSAPIKPRKVITTHSLQQEVELKTAEKPWKPELEAEKTKIIETGQMDTTRLLKVFRGHLNKLTPQKYDSLIAKIAELDLESPERLNSVIDLVFDKAVDEPGFCELYASMCKVIACKNSAFSFHLVKKCQEEFETADLYTGLRVDDRKIEIEQEPDLAKKKLLSEELYEDMRLRRKKYLGTIKLIGEMYKLGLLLPKIIGLCMSHLISDVSNENIECLCSLITTVGAKMAIEPDRAIQDSLKKTLELLKGIAHHSRAEEIALESRIKFKILDTIDLSKRNWRPRMVENNPKKIEEIREEAEREKQMNHQQQHYNHSNQSKNLLKNNDRDDRDRDRQPRRTSNFLKKNNW